MDDSLLQSGFMIKFHLNKQLQSVNSTSLHPQLTLNEYIRNVSHLTGTKFMCVQGRCGACIVTAKIKNALTNELETLTVNSCLVSLLSCDGWQITTVEGLGNRNDGYHQIQQKIVQFNATQCGFCTPGMVMNMYGLLEAGKPTMAEIEDSFGGSICRCTGYRPILAAFKSLASDYDEKLMGRSDSCDIEDYLPCSKKTDCKHSNAKCIANCVNNQNGTKIIGIQRANNWFRVKTINHIFAIFKDSRFSEKTYQLVHGNTAKALFSDIARKDLYIDISNVTELTNYSLNTSALKLGANCTLTQTINIFTDILKRDDGFAYLSKLIEHLGLVASVSLRNVGTVAGNLFTKHEHNEFASDIFLMLETIAARINIYDGHKTYAVSPVEFMQFNMRHKIILSIELPPMTKEYKVEFYKIMPTAQISSADLNAGFLLKIDSNHIVEQATIVFGGINPSFIHAQQTESLARGAKLFDNTHIQNVFAKLNSEVQPDYVIPNASPEFRKGVAIALFYKFILSIAPNVPPRFVSGGEKLVRAAVSNGVQDFTTNKSMYPIGEPISKLEAAEQASGSAKYVSDMLDLPGQLHAAFVLGQATPGSVLKALNPEKALAIVGVEAFLTAADIPGNNSFMAASSHILYFEDEPIFIAIGEEIKAYFQPVGMILAESRNIALEAVEHVQVTFEQTNTRPLLTIQDVLEQNKSSRIKHQETYAPKSQDYNVSVEFKGKFSTGGQYQYHMELQVANIVPSDDGGLMVYPTSHWMTGIQFALTKALNIQSNKLQCTTKRVGGSFGARLTRNNWVTCAAAVGALKLGRPVKLYLSQAQNMKIMGKRNPYYCEYEIGAKANGAIGYLNNDIYHNVGAYANSLYIRHTAEAFLQSYKSDSYQTDTYQVKTDIPSSSAARGPGTFEGVAIIESIIDHIAFKTNIDPLDVRLANLDEAKNPILKKLVLDCQVWSNYRARRAEIEIFNKNSRWRKRGIAITCMSFPLEFVGSHYAQVSVFQDGSVAVMHGGIEFGQGINTVVAQTTAFILGIDLISIQIRATDTMFGPSQTATGGSITSTTVCLAVAEACEHLKTRIENAARIAKLPSDAGWNAKVENAYTNGISLTENQMFVQDHKNNIDYTVYGVAVSEVEVDILTGKTIIQRVDLMEDCGDSSNPAIDIGQCEGAFVMGIGHWLTENIKFNENGEIKTIDAMTYRVPGAKDIPVEFRVKIPDGIPNPKSPYRNKATTEPPICLSVSVPLAIRHALKTARMEADDTADTWVPLYGPSTVEWTFLNSLNAYKQYKL